MIATSNARNLLLPDSKPGIGHDLTRLRAWMQKMKNNSSHSPNKLDFSKFKGFDKLFVLESKQQRRANTRLNRYLQHFGVEGRKKVEGRSKPFQKYFDRRPRPSTSKYCQLHIK